MTKRKKDITGYEYDELMSTLRVSVSKHFLDESFSLVWANDYYYELIRYTKEEYEEKFYNNPQLYYTYHHFESELEKIREAVIEALAAGKHGYAIVTRMPTNGGSYLWVRLSGSFTDEYIDGKQVSYTVMSDIDDLVRMQTEQSITYNNIPGFVARFAVDEEKHLKLLYANDHFVGFFGCNKPLDETNDVFLKNIKLNAEKIDELWPLIKEGKPIRFLARVENRKGDTLWMQISGECVDRIAGQFIYLLIYIDVTDVTGLREMQKKLEAALAAEEKANRAKTVFLSHMSHDIRTPINGIMGMTDIALRNIDDRARISDCLAKINSASQHLLGLVNDVLDMSRIESGKVQIDGKPFSVLTLLDGCCSVIMGQTIKKQITLQTDFSRLQQTLLKGDELHLRQILINILGNAVKFTPSGGKVMFTASSKKISDAEAEFIAVIRDNGIGMSREFQSRIFEPFSQEEENGSSYRGTGLGMSIVKQLLELMGGKIEVKSTPGEGSTFTVRLLLPVDTEERGEKGEKNFAEDLTGIRILLAEDNELNMEIALYLLEDRKARVTPVSNGREAVDTFVKNPRGSFDIILMDIQMPVMDGYEATRKIRSVNRPDAKKIPIIAMTANAFTEDVQAALDAGMNAHIAKPIDVKALYAEIRTFISEEDYKE